jgi:hypothetical protein
MHGEIKISSDELKVKRLSFSEWIVLWELYFAEKMSNITIDPTVYDKMQGKAYIFEEDDGSFSLLPKGKELFESSDEFFDEFISLFPTRVKLPTGETRILSPNGGNTAVGLKLLKKWKVITKSNPETQKHLVDCLKAEIELRTKTNTLQWMRNSETWLNKCTWEDYEYLLKEGKEIVEGGRVNELKL